MAARAWWNSPISAVIPAVIITIGTLASAAHIPVQPGERGIDGLAIVLGLVGAWSLLLRWSQPWVMIALIGGCVTTYAALGYPGGPVYLSAPVGLLSFGLVRARRQLYVVAGVLLVSLFVAMSAHGGSWTDAARPVGLLGWIGAVVLLTEVLRGRSERRRAESEARRRQQERAVVEQQLGLARDLHDSVAHALTAINVQSVIAERMVQRDPAASADAARAIRETSRQALVELTDIVRSLRSPDDEAPRAPDRGLAQVDALVAQARSGGLEVEFQRVGGPRAIREEVGIAAYRLVQEALTNVIRHAPGSRVDLEIDERRGLRLAVSDDGGDPARAGERVQGSGQGLLGMRERVVGSGGTLHHGPCQPKGFEVIGTWEEPDVDV